MIIASAFLIALSFCCPPTEEDMGVKVFAGVMGTALFCAAMATHPKEDSDK